MLRQNLQSSRAVAGGHRWDGNSDAPDHHKQSLGATAGNAKETEQLERLANAVKYFINKKD